MMWIDDSAGWGDIPDVNAADPDPNPGGYGSIIYENAPAKPAGMDFSALLSRGLDYALQRDKADQEFKRMQQARAMGYPLPGVMQPVGRSPLLSWLLIGGAVWLIVRAAK